MSNTLCFQYVFEQKVSPALGCRRATSPIGLPSVDVDVCPQITQSNNSSVVSLLAPSTAVLSRASENELARCNVVLKQYTKQNVKKVKSAYEPSGSSGRSISRFL